MAILQPRLCRVERLARATNRCYILSLREAVAVGGVVRSLLLLPSDLAFASLLGSLSENFNCCLIYDIIAIIDTETIGFAIFSLS
jgi:hypothetical protein